MSLTTALIVNGILVVAVIAALTYVCRIPFRLDAGRSEAPAVADERLAA